MDNTNLSCDFQIHFSPSSVGVFWWDWYRCKALCLLFLLNIVFCCVSYTVCVVFEKTCRSTNANSRKCDPGSLFLLMSAGWAGNPSIWQYHAGQLHTAPKSGQLLGLPNFQGAATRIADAAYRSPLPSHFTKAHLRSVTGTGSRARPRGYLTPRVFQGFLKNSFRIKN